jgi:hypothetical protein
MRSARQGEGGEDVNGESPEAWQVKLEPNIRRAPLHRFPLSIVYREKSGAFQILAVAHDRRRPYYWLGRL